MRVCLVVSAAAGCLLAVAQCAPAQTGELAATVATMQPDFTGKLVRGLMGLNHTCVYEGTTAYVVTVEGELWVQGAVACGTLRQPSAGEPICHLNPSLQCVAQPSFRLSGTHYSVTDDGVSAGAGVMPWQNKAQAIGLFDVVRRHAKLRCDFVLLHEAQSDPTHAATAPTFPFVSLPPPPISLPGYPATASVKAPDPTPPSLVLEEQSCRPYLSSVCAAGAMPEKPRYWKDVSKLCPGLEPTRSPP